MIIVTGSAGFIGSNLVRKLNDEGFKDIVLVDDFSEEEKNKILTSKKKHIIRNLQKHFFYSCLYLLDTNGNRPL